MKPIITLSFLLVVNVLFSQTKISGNVSDNDGPLAGANIIIKDSQKGATSDLEGNFQIVVKPRDTLVITYLGYDSKEIMVGKQEDLEVKLDGNIALDEVRITAYGSHMCRTVCCCIGVIKSEYMMGFKSDVITEKLYPNPSTTGRFQLKLLKDFKQVDIQIYTITGQFIKGLLNKPSDKTMSLDLSEYSSGIYIINLNANGKQIASKKAIIQ
ncbi:carboxypeptidase-like regulatory domain-containing protein [Hyunsoonleella sp. SJ7]|uniref:Carboxypeptidase-like regulatory domain-containing protein n=1 Tax=Hyunsoonleella aquatilis TaxID=2762758 RepID=A0A923HBF7_9FLAO|nr:carboxypeptidase-like regulatory domain-containing protein [Hyunsoonleella aquatilis]MBC3757991.1 carboxypeptidase-like regulatory domain-containing protein [Hyunsoonleella aquatilis]